MKSYVFINNAIQQHYKSLLHVRVNETNEKMSNQKYSGEANLNHLSSKDLDPPEDFKQMAKDKKILFVKDIKKVKVR